MSKLPYIVSEYWKQKTHFFIWMRIHTLPPFLVGLWQAYYLRRILKIAYESVGLYRRRLDEVSLSPDRIRFLGDIKLIPVLSKEAFRAAPTPECIAQNYPERYIYWTRTSGTTGAPLRLAKNKISYLGRNFYLILRVKSVENVYMRRFLFWRGETIKEMFGNFKITQLRVNRFPENDHYQHLPISELRENPERTILRLANFAPNVLDGRATALVELARHVNRLPPGRRPHPTYILSHGENLNSAQRNLINKAFDNKLYNTYGTAEVGCVGIECDYHNGIHIFEETYIVEILDDRNNPVSEGAWGRIVVTNLFEDVMPFIRYDTGDRGMIMTGKCSCGVSTRRLAVSGRRIAGFFDFGEGKLSIGELEVIISRYYDLILRCQFAKTGLNTLEMRLVPVENFSKKDLENLRKDFQDELRYQPIIKLVDSIPFSQGGKTLFFVDETTNK